MTTVTMPIEVYEGIMKCKIIEEQSEENSKLKKERQEAWKLPHLMKRTMYEKKACRRD